jgi:hypothetical protein
MFGLSTLGIIHTAISLIAVLAALASFVTRGSIKPKDFLGRLYLVTTIIACLTAFGLSKHGGLNPGHALAALTLLSLAAAILSEKFSVRGWRYVQVSLLSLSLFFSLIPATAETLTRLPVGAPLATGPQDPLVGRFIGILFFLFVMTLLGQIIYLRKTNAKSIS